MKKKIKKKFELVRFSTGNTPRSIEAITKHKEILEENFQGKYKLKLVDIVKKPELAESENIIATPLVVRKLPQPIRRILGDLKDKENVLLGLGLKEYRK
jgi:circadian clock protein KaiB